ncbi:signal recognition particle receptor beta subunit-domain-containing protein [Glomus cerebriforme]|uniref:Signal recognition particle receptor subunit beta n=1 Tax=Glomus cerebriforme TaxID=658196 RepID=A0A397T033_9GLOM|nr:signal recognition particle receptor beta subunit-domain-containing protein [Glomus cerebriforme]
MDNSTFTLITWIILTILAIIIAIIFNVLKNRSRKDTFLILGLADSGKTSFFIKLRDGKQVQTHTSMKENEGYINLENNGIPLTKVPIHFVDVPGHEKLRFKFSDFIPITRGIIFLVDSSTCVKNVRSIAEYLYDIFSNKDVIKHNIPTLIACNKSDMITALPPERIQTMLENEINKLRNTRTSALDNQDSSITDNIEFLGYENEKFKFEHLENETHFEKCSVDKNEIAEIKNWIAEVYGGR